MDMYILKKTYTKYALIMCGIIILCLAYMELSGNNESFVHSPFGWIMFVAPLIVWFFGIKEYKNTLKGKMTFKQAMAEGFRISLVFGIISPFIFLAYYLWVNPAIVETVKLSFNMRGASNSAVIATDMTIQFVMALVMGTIISLPIAFVLKSKHK